MSPETQALCFLAGANSIFAGEKLLTQQNNGENADRALIEKLGMHFIERPLAQDSAPPKKETHLLIAG